MLILQGFQVFSSLGTKVTLMSVVGPLGTESRHRQTQARPWPGEGGRRKPELKVGTLGHHKCHQDARPSTLRDPRENQNAPLLCGSIHPCLQFLSEWQSVLGVGYCREKDKIVRRKYHVSLRCGKADVCVHAKMLRRRKKQHYS